MDCCGNNDYRLFSTNNEYGRLNKIDSFWNKNRIKYFFFNFNTVFFNLVPFGENAGEKYEYDPDFKGPKSHRSPTDVFWLVAFLIFTTVWLTMGFCGEFSISIFQYMLSVVCRSF